MPNLRVQEYGEPQLLAVRRTDDLAVDHWRLARLRVRVPRPDSIHLDARGSPRVRGVSVSML